MLAAFLLVLQAGCWDVVPSDEAAADPGAGSDPGEPGSDPGLETGDHPLAPPTSVAEETCDDLRVGATEIAQDHWGAADSGVLFTGGVYACLAVGMAMDAPGGRVYALAHLGLPGTFDGAFTAMIARLEELGGDRATLETWFGQATTDDPWVLPVARELAVEMDLNLLGVVADFYGPEASPYTSIVEFAFDGLVFRYRVNGVCDAS